jgi:hypothetical protein
VLEAVVLLPGPFFSPHGVHQVKEMKIPFGVVFAK